METQDYQQNKGFRLLKFNDIVPEIPIVHDIYEDDPLESMLYGIELNRELSASHPKPEVIGSVEGVALEKKLKHLRFYVNEISNHFGLDD